MITVNCPYAISQLHSFSCASISAGQPTKALPLGCELFTLVSHRQCCALHLLPIQSIDRCDDVGTVSISILGYHCSCLPLCVFGIANLMDAATSGYDMFCSHAFPLFKVPLCMCHPLEITMQKPQDAVGLTRVPHCITSPVLWLPIETLNPCHTIGMQFVVESFPAA